MPNPTIGTVVRVAYNVAVPELRGKAVTVLGYRIPSYPSYPTVRAYVREILDSGDLGQSWLVATGQLIPL